jgi:catechol 2,3-dioxygenase-like lactoylglutathione lyase family enzyme
MMRVKLEHFGIYARDTKALADWYIDTLGFHVVRTLEKEGRPPIYFLSASEGGEIEILPTQKPHAERSLNQAGFSHIGLIVDDFASVEAQLAAKGIRLADARETSNGWKIGYFEDPEGNTLEIVCR